MQLLLDKNFIIPSSFQLILLEWSWRYSCYLIVAQGNSSYSKKSIMFGELFIQDRWFNCPEEFNGTEE
jgi:hypothetical protein